MISDSQTMRRMVGAICCFGFGLLSNAAWASNGSVDSPYRIAMVLWRGETEVEAGFRSYMDANDVHVDIAIHDVARDPSKIPEFISEIRSSRPDLVYTWGTSVTLAVAGAYNAVDSQSNITEIPILFTMVADPEGAGIVPDLSSSGRNVTGTAFLAPLATQLRTIEEYFGGMPSVGVIYNSNERNSSLNVKALRESSITNSFTLHEVPVPLGDDGKPDPSTLPGLVDHISDLGAEVLYIGPDSFLAVNGDVLTEAAIERGVATFAATERPLRKARAMMGLVSNYFTLGQFVAFKALRLLRGEIEPIDSPIETLSRFSFMLNMPVALRLEQYPPISMLKYAVLIDEASLSYDSGRTIAAPARTPQPPGQLGLIR